MAGIKLTLRIKGQDSERRTATARNAEHLKDICRRWLAGHSDRSIRAEYMLQSTTTPYGKPHETVAGYIQVWAAKRGWRQEEPKDEQADVLMQAFRVPAGMDVEKVIREALDNAKLHQPERAMDAPGYEHLAAVLKDAYAQAAFGKGKERHANDLPFDHQPMQAISRLLGNPTGMTYQVCKKVVEAMNMKDRAARRRELLGAIVYLAGVVVYEDNENGNG